MPHTSLFRVPQSVAALALALMLSTTTADAEVKPELWDGQRALTDIAALLKFTPRSLDTAGHQLTIDYIKAEFAKLDVNTVATQRWVFKDDGGKAVAMTNIVARLDPSNPRRVILATHYDSIVRAYRDPKNPNAPMPGANNSASGVAVLLETARVLSLSEKPPVGVDMIFFDGEEGPKSLGAGDPAWHALGSPYFAAHLKDYYPKGKPEKAVVFDMVCDKDLALKPEPFSLASATGEVQKYWSIGARIAQSSFPTATTSYPISDDHNALAEVGIPSFLVIDFDYEPFFNTSADTIDKCSAQSLEAVGRTTLQYLYSP
jgi:glutaminyl-peptide cyclotransferase